MKPSVMLFFTILGIFATFLLCAGASLVGVTMSYGRSNRYGGWDQNPPPKTAVVLVAREDIPAGTKIARAEDKFRVRIYRIGEEPRDAISDYRQIGGMVLARPLHKGEICTLAHVHNQFFLVPLPDGKKAFSFRTTLAPEIAGVIVPTARVDVSGQVVLDQYGQGGFKVVAQDAVVLAVNAVQLDPQEPQVVQSAPGVEPGKLVVITVAVTPDEAVALLGAMRQQPLTVTLRAKE